MVATMRAAHLLLDDEPKILQDDLAMRLSGAENEVTLRANLDAYLAEFMRWSTPAFAQAVFRYLRAIMTMRNRYAEDELDEALQLGVAQYVILGAGLDSFAYRRSDLAGVLRVFEVDQPTTQRWKQIRLQELHIDPPPNLTYIPLDFEKQSLTDGLRAGGCRLEAPAFFSWLGVTRYLTPEAVFRTFREITCTAPGSEIVFDYSLPESLLDSENQQYLAVVRATTGNLGETWFSLLEPVSLATRLRELGFAQTWDFGPEEAFARYFVGRTDGLRSPNAFHLMKARVGTVP